MVGVGEGSWVATPTAVSSRERLTYLFYTGDIGIRRIDRLRDIQAEREASRRSADANTVHSGDRDRDVPAEVACLEDVG